MTGFISNDDETAYRDEVTRFVNWCDENLLVINVRKTKEIIFDFHKIKNVLTPLRIKNVDVEIVDEYKYLGTHIDKNLN